MKLFLFKFLFLYLFVTPFSLQEQDAENYNHYLSISSQTDPGEYSFMLDELPDDIIGICKVAKQQTIHHNLLPYFDIPKSQWDDMKKVWPPKLANILQALNDIHPYNLYDERKPEQRIIGACVMESYFLTGMLRYKNIPVRIRAGYFKDIRANSEHVINFWENVSREKGIAEELLRDDPARWKEVNNSYTKQQNDVNHYIEHWLCEYWDKNTKKWRLLDANNTFLKAHSNIDVGYHLPEEHFEYAFEAWKKMRSSQNFDPNQYREGDQDGRSHIRSQLLSNFFNLLNHDLSCYSNLVPESRKFIKERKYNELTDQELRELDLLAHLLSKEPTKEELVVFYNKSNTLKIESAEKDSYSFVFKE
jgi:hypothetical protein